MYIIKKILTTCILSGLVSACASAAPVSSHNQDQLISLLNGCVFVHRDIDDNNTTSYARYYGKEGKSVMCGAKNTAPIVYISDWTTIFSEKQRSLVTIKYPALDLNYKAPFIYDPVSGITYNWRWISDRRTHKWQRTQYGHLQDSWPAFAKKNCPNAPIPDDLPINEKQTSDHYPTLLKQDPSAPLKNLLPPSVPFGDISSKEEILDYIASTSGQILEPDGPEGRKYVFNVKRSQLYETTDGEDIVDVAKVANLEDGQISIEWQNKPTDIFKNFQEVYQQFASQNTGELHAVFKFLNWLTAQESVIVPKFSDDTPITFTDSGVISYQSQAGRWWRRGGQRCYRCVAV